MDVRVMDGYFVDDQFDKIHKVAEYFYREER
jgi:hypothetical protein